MREQPFMNLIDFRKKYPDLLRDFKRLNFSGQQRILFGNTGLYLAGSRTNNRGWLGG